MLNHMGLFELYTPPALRPKNHYGLLLFSGGMDSYMMWRLLGEPECLYVMLGHRYMRREIATIEKLQDYVGWDRLQVHYSSRITLDDMERDDAFIPNRNLFLLTTAVTEFPHKNEVYLGALYGEASRDKSGRFMRSAGRLLRYMNRSHVHISAPYRWYTKAGLVKHFLSNFPNDVDILKMTSACYGKVLPYGAVGCGECNACFRRWVAMSLNGIEETYGTRPDQWAKKQLNLNWRDVFRHWQHVSFMERAAVAYNNFLAAKAITKADDNLSKR